MAAAFTRHIGNALPPAGEVAGVLAEEGMAKAALVVPLHVRELIAVVHVMHNDALLTTEGIVR